jgi:hypothetical protein
MPNNPAVNQGGTVAFNALGGTPPYTFAFVSNPSGGTIDSWGNYTAGPSSGTDYVSVTDSATPTPATLQVAIAVNAPLSVTLTQPVNNAVVTQMPLQVSGTATVGANLQVMLDGMQVASGSSAGTFSFQIGQSLSTGQHMIEVDASQGQAMTKATASFTFQASGLQLMAPPNGAAVTPPVTLQGVASPNQQVTVYLDGMPVGSPMADPMGNWSLPLMSSPSPGTHSWYATSGATQTQPFSFTVNGAVTGTQIITYVNDAGSTQQPVDLSQSFIQALVDDGKGNFTGYQGTGAADGSFSIPNVPAGPYLLRINGRTWAMSSRTVDLGYTTAGRASAQPAPAGSTTVIDATGLQAWDQTNHYLQLFSSQLGLVNYPDTSTIPIGSTLTSSDLTADWSDTAVQNGQASASLLVDGTQGDIMTLSQLVNGTSTAGQYWYVSTYGTLPSYTQPAGSPITEAVALASVAPSSTLNLNWLRSQFEALTPQVNPNATTSASAFVGGTGVQERVGFQNAQILNFEDDLKTDLNAQFAYADPFPASWTEAIQLQHVATVNVTAPGATTAKAFQVPTLVQNELVSTVNAGPLTPRVGPAQSLVVDNQSAFGSGQANISINPVISWKPPVVGSAQRYVVTLTQVANNGSGGTVVQQVAKFNTTATTLTIPPGTMNGAGSAYLVQVTSWFDPGFNPSRPNEHPLAPNAWSNVVSNVLTTSPTALGVTSPADGSTVAAGTINLQGTAPPGTIVNVFKDGGISVGQATADPTGHWSIATTVGPGQHNFGAGYGSLFSYSNSFTAQ